MIDQFVYQQATGSDSQAVPLSLLIQGRVVLHSAFRYNLYKTLVHQGSSLPMISCIMVTKNRSEQAKLAIQCFQNQTYTNKELIIVDDDSGDRLAQHINELGDRTIHYWHLEPNQQALSELQNFALTHTSGPYICQWDDDDLADPMRLELQMTALQILNADACFLQRLLLWWTNSKRLAVSRGRVWDSSFLCLKAKLTTYPTMPQRSESVSALGQVLQDSRVALLDYPYLYTYVIHGQNTFDKTHFDHYWKLAKDAYEGETYEIMLEQLANRLPVEAYCTITSREQ